jgi:hypothetical protein
MQMLMYLLTSEASPLRIVFTTAFIDVGSTSRKHDGNTVDTAKDGSHNRFIGPRARYFTPLHSPSLLHVSS